MLMKGLVPWKDLELCAMTLMDLGAGEAATPAERVDEDEDEKKEESR